MNYESMSDFEINYLVAKIDTDGEVIGKDDMWTTDNENSVQVIYKVGISGEYKDYCNSPADMWPIILQYGINTNFHQHGCMSTALIESGTNLYRFTHENPLRAAAIVFLMMQEAK